MPSTTSAGSGVQNTIACNTAARRHVPDVGPPQRGIGDDERRSRGGDVQHDRHDNAWAGQFEYRGKQQRPADRRYRRGESGGGDAPYTVHGEVLRHGEMNVRIVDWQDETAVVATGGNEDAHGGTERRQRQRKRQRARGQRYAAP